MFRACDRRTCRSPLTRAYVAPVRALLQVRRSRIPTAGWSQRPARGTRGGPRLPATLPTQPAFAGRAGQSERLFAGLGAQRRAGWARSPVAAVVPVIVAGNGSRQPSAVGRQPSKACQQIAFRRDWSSRTSSRTAGGIRSLCHSSSRSLAVSTSSAWTDARAALIA